MQDFNFFEPYLVKTRQAGDSLPLVPVVLLMVAILSAWPLFNLVYGLMIGRQVGALETEIVNSAEYPLLQTKANLSTEISQAQSSLGTMDQADQQIQGLEWLDEPFLFSLLSAVPKDIQLDSVSILAEKQVKLSGTAAGKPAIAELEHNLRQSSRFENLIVETIDSKLGTYNFQMSFSVKGGES